MASDKGSEKSGATTNASIYSVVAGIPLSNEDELVEKLMSDYDRLLNDEDYWRWCVRRVRGGDCTVQALTDGRDICVKASMELPVSVDMAFHYLKQIPNYREWDASFMRARNVFTSKEMGAYDVRYYNARLTPPWPMAKRQCYMLVVTILADDGSKHLVGRSLHNVPLTHQEDKPMAIYCNAITIDPVKDEQGAPLEDRCLLTRTRVYNINAGRLGTYLAYRKALSRTPKSLHRLRDILVEKRQKAEKEQAYKAQWSELSSVTSHEN